VDWNGFLEWEKASQDTVDFKKIYVDIVDDIIVGLLLSQIIYWHLPGKNGKSKLRVKRNARLYISKTRYEWWDEIRISPSQVDRGLKILKSLGIVEVEYHRFNGLRTSHIYLDKVKFLERFQNTIEFSLQNPHIRRSENRSSQKVKTEVKENVNPITETTTKSTTKNTINPPSVPPIQGGNDHPSDDLRLSLSQSSENQKAPVLKLDGDEVLKPLFKGEDECDQERIRQKQAFKVKYGDEIP